MILNQAQLVNVVQRKDHFSGLQVIATRRINCAIFFNIGNVRAFLDTLFHM